jgi:hypothetical protein
MHLKEDAMPIRLPRTTSQLPRDLFRKDSDLDVMVSVADDAATQCKFGAEATVNVAWQMLKRACPDYKATMLTINDQNQVGVSILCASGERDARPFRFECQFCRVSQFSVNGVFTGDLIPVTALLHQSA